MATKTGEMLLGAMNIRNLMVAAALGVLVFQLVSLLPAIGPLVAFLARACGAGALVYRLVRRPQREQPVPFGAVPHPST